MPRLKWSAYSGYCMVLTLHCIRSRVFAVCTPNILLEFSLFLLFLSPCLCLRWLYLLLWFYLSRFALGGTACRHRMISKLIKLLLLQTLNHRNWEWQHSYFHIYHNYHVKLYFFKQIILTLIKQKEANIRDLQRNVIFNICSVILSQWFYRL